MQRRLYLALGDRASALVLAFFFACSLPLAAEDPASGGAGAVSSEGSAAPSSKAATPAAGSASAATSAPVQTLEPGIGRDAMITELSTAGYYELVARARELGIDDSGSVEEIRARLYAYYGLEAPASVDSGKGKIVTIERASEASFAKVEEEEGGIVKASGGVLLSLVEENGDTHRIRADSIVYNRARSTLTARGSVYYERKSGSTTEIFTGEALSADLNDWSGVFLDGRVRKIGSGASATAASSVSSSSSSSTSTSSSGSTSDSERGFAVQADTILRRTSDVMVLEDGTISPWDEPDPHYSIRAKHLWLLGDTEFAVTDAVLSVGNVPMLWLPFFFYPGDELVFHPVVGYDSRKGRFVQTTVYLIGQKPASTTTSSVMGFQGSSDGPTELKGLFLRHVAGEKPKDTGTLKTIFDLYSGLGGVAGISGSFDKLGPLGKTDLYATGAMSRSLFLTSENTYSPYVSDGNWASVWNSSNFLGLSLPFRYGFNFSTTFTGGGLTTNLALPIYSDPYYAQDFTDRSEDMDWFSLFQSSTSSTSTVSVLSQLMPTLSTTFTAKPDSLPPWISSFSITKLSTYATLLTKSSTAAELGEDSTLFTYDPRQTFFYPSIFRPFDAALSLKGTLFSTGASGSQKKDNAKDKAGAAESKLELKSPWDDSGTGSAPLSDNPDAAAKDDTTATEQNDIADATNDGLAASLKQPVRAESPSATKPQDWTASLGWTLTPAAYYEDAFLSENWGSASDIDYSLLYNLFSYKATGSLDAALGYGDYLSSTLSLAYTDQNQYRPYLYSGTNSTSSTWASDQSTAATYQLADKLYQNRLFAESTGVTVKPLADSWLWSGSSVAWNLNSTIYDYDYNSTSSSFSETWLGWNTDSITAHNLSMTLAARPGGLTQSLSLIAALPPTLDSYTGKLSFDAGIGSFSLQSRMYRASEGADFSYDPLTAALSVGVAPWPVLADTFIYDVFTSVQEPESNVVSLTWGPLSSSLTSKQTYSYTPEASAGWQQTSTAESFDFTDFGLTLAPEIKGDLSASGGPLWSLKPSLALAQSLVYFTTSSLEFDLNASFKLDDKLTFSFSSSSVNSEAWRYYAGLFSSELSAVPGYNYTAAQFQVNPLEDIWDSLQIWDTNSLTQSLFKLKSLSFKVEQDLVDWTLSAEVATAPLYNSTTSTYSLDTTFTILIKWKDMSSIKTKIVKTSSASSGTDNTLSY
jgi:hypothetical protein